MIQANVIAMSGHAIEAAGDVDTLILDKTGTITLGNREAIALIPATGVSMQKLAEGCLISILADLTPEGRSIMALVQKNHTLKTKSHPKQLYSFTAESRMSGANIPGRKIRKEPPRPLRITSTSWVVPPSCGSKRGRQHRQTRWHTSGGNGQ